LKREPFIGYQVTSHVEFAPTVLCRERDKEGGYDAIPIYCSSEQLHGIRRKAADFLYEKFRVLSRDEAKYLQLLLDSGSPDIVHCHYLPDAAFFRCVTRGFRIPVVVSAYGYDTSEFPRRYLGYGRRYIAQAMAGASAIIAMSPDMKQDLVALGCPSEKIHVHYYGVETAALEFPGRTYENKTPLTVLMVAGFDQYKGHIFLLRAVKEIVHDRHKQSFKVRLVGQGSLEAKLRRYVRDNDLEGVVEFAGFIPRDGQRIYDEYRKADIFVMPSVTEKGGLKEGIPGALVEAMASGLPCVATRHAGIPYVATHEKDALLVNERDMSGLAGSLERLLDEPLLRQRLGAEAARRAVGQFDCRRRILALEDIYKSLLRT
jgi:colanic acid/amylovoran biosynthesis glycosyltransferase